MEYNKKASLLNLPFRIGSIQMDIPVLRFVL